MNGSGEMSPYLPVSASEEQKAKEVSFLCKLKPERRRSLEQRICNGRPKEEELALIETMKTDVRERLEKRLRGTYSKVEAFMSAMFYWYQKLEQKKKQRLTAVQLKKQALLVCREYGIEYYNNGLPRDWVQTMKDQLGMKLHQHKKRTSTTPEKRSNQQ